ncbi:hypothetical protein GCM10009544_03470 [Streptomyces stramineus]|uniref:Uncharacterized protein n=1 Tax=Streptomyces stramineus TaxID=173861 RepID=A0ABN0ZDP2_9ACTN
MVAPHQFRPERLGDRLVSGSSETNVDGNTHAWTLRLHFTAEDLACTHVASEGRPLLELTIGIRLLQEHSHPWRFDAWRQRATAPLRVVAYAA